MFKSLLLLLLPIFSLAQAGTPILMGFYSEWGRYYSDHTPDQLQGELLTHLVYESIALTHDGQAQFWDPKSGQANMAQLAGIKADQDLTLLASFGGWNEQAKLTDLVASSESIEQTAHAMVQFVHNQGFDGVLIDWRYPGINRDGISQLERDRQGLVRLVTRLHEQAPEMQIWLTLAPYSQALELIPFAQIDSLISGYSLLSVDMAGPWQATTNFISPLYDPQPGSQMYPGSIDSAVQFYLNQGLEGGKLVVNVSALGRSWQGVPATAAGLYQPSSGSGWHSYRHQKDEGAVSRHDLFKLIYDQQFQYHYHQGTESAWLYHQGLQQFVSYEDSRALTAKAAYVQANQLAGLGVQYLFADTDVLIQAHQLLFNDQTTSKGHGFLGWVLGVVLLLLAALASLVSYRYYGRTRRSTHSKVPQLQQAGQQVLDFIQHHQSHLDHELSLQKLAKALGLTTHQLSQILNDELGKGFYELINGYRIEEAKRLLAHSDHSIADILKLAGFNTKATFNSCFKKSTGITPGQWRKENRKELVFD